MTVKYNHFMMCHFQLMHSVSQQIRCVLQEGCKFWDQILCMHVKVVSIGRLTAFYVVLVPVELIPSKPPLYAYVIVSFCTLQKGSTF